jgi:crotonobetainyl-CoA:carnitine CoA-transferase CaiB-like acyl-CoA transferase
MLADLGAEVIKIKKLGVGDDIRILVACNIQVATITCSNAASNN